MTARTIEKARHFRFALLAAVLAAFFPLACTECSADSGFYYSTRPNYYLLTTDIDLLYEKRWVTEGTGYEYERLTPRMVFNLKGFASDPRIITFDLTTEFGLDIQREDKIDTDHFYGIGARISLLNQQVRRGFLKYLPQPIELRFGLQSSEDERNISYGMSLTYRRSESIRFFGPGKLVALEEPMKYGQKGFTSGNGTSEPSAVEERKGYVFTFPLFHLDYDHNQFSSGANKTATDRLNLRVESYGQKSQFRAEYYYEKYKTDDWRQVRHQVWAEGIYQDYNPEKMLTFDSRNVLNYVSVEGGSLLNMSTFNGWRKDLDKHRRDFNFFSIGGNYSRSDDGSVYDVTLSDTYMKFVSDRFDNTVIGTASFGEGLTGTVHSESLTNSLRYRLSQSVEVVNTLSATLDNNGLGFGGDIAVYSGWRQFGIVTGYSYSDTALEDGRTRRHLLRLDITGRVGNAYFVSTNSYTRINEDRGGVSFDEDALGLSGDLFWWFSRYSVNLGARYYNFWGNDRSARQNDWYALIRGSVTAALQRRLYLSLSANYFYWKNGDTELDITSSISWGYREISFALLYEARIISNDSDRTDHRVYGRLTRHFTRKIRPFF